ncbi:poly(ADP-ribose) glycohydrolase isoform X5 [Trachinotus anak]|uniref:poly(ADP-ribose) glycohydrolase isoform X5 n=1 Tax=Trachinotus anak TaxID=443729 RepID=UPI0039F1A143
MAAPNKHHNDSSQVNQLLHPDGQSESCQKGRQSDREHNSRDRDSSSQSSSSGPSWTGGGSGRAGGEGEQKEQKVQKEQKEQREQREQREQGSSSCCPQSEMKRLSGSNSRLNQLTCSRTHTVLIDVDAFNRGARLMPHKGRDVWLSDFVKMPCSHWSVMTIKSGLLKQPSQVCRWEVISKQLKGLASKREVSVDDVEEAIIKYNPKYKGQWSFDALSSFVKCIPKEENYFSTLFPKIAALALRLPDVVMKAIPLLKKGQTATITLSQVQISCLLANAFFCTFPHRNTSSPNAEYHGYPTINFNGLFGNWVERKKEKLRAIMHYFKVVTDEKTAPRGLVTFERRHLRDADLPNWRSCKEKLHKLHVTSHGSIETEGTGMLQVDFAASRIGGGVLGSGLVQEEILFLINPELIVSRLFTEKLADSECLIITGSQQFSTYSGFRDTFEWAGPHMESVKRDEWARLKRQILAIDALHFKHVRDQYKMINVTRELNKAFCGFMGDENNEPDIATGKWGCGAFNGDPQLKAVIQLMAAAKARRGLAFFTFGDEKLKQGLEQIYHLLVTEGTTVDTLYGLLEDYCAVQAVSRDSHVDLFEFIKNTVRCSRSQL